LCDVAVGVLEDVALVRVPVVAPVAAALVVLGCVGLVSQSVGQERDAEVLVGVLDAAADAACGWARAVPDVVLGDVADFVPAGEVPASFGAPVG
jgi:hypothetical protein